MFVIPGVVYGIVAKTITSSKDVIEGMTKAMHQMSYYLVIMFFIAQFVYAFGQSNLGVLLALKGAEGLQAIAMPAAGRLRKPPTSPMPSCARDSRSFGSIPSRCSGTRSTRLRSCSGQVMTEQPRPERASAYVEKRSEPTTTVAT